MGKRTLRAVHDDDLVEFLDRVGILEDLKAGRVSCRYCQELLDLESLEAVYPEQGQVRAVCSEPSCLLRFATDRFNS